MARAGANLKKTYRYKLFSETREHEDEMASNRGKVGRGELN
jgi:hypothetical protein